MKIKKERKSEIEILKELGYTAIICFWSECLKRGLMLTEDWDWGKGLIRSIDLEREYRNYCKKMGKDNVDSEKISGKLSYREEHKMTPSPIFEKKIINLTINVMKKKIKMTRHPDPIHSDKRLIPFYQFESLGKCREDFEKKSLAQKPESFTDKIKEKETEGVVYALESEVTKKIKIGNTHDFRERLKSLRAGCSESLNVLFVIKDTGGLEKFLHSKFKKYRIHHEWFDGYIKKELINWASSYKRVI